MTDDQELLRDYRERKSEAAFAQLVQRHVDLVYSTARRIVGEPEIAKDVSQSVFIHFARKAGSIRVGKAVPGWLYRVTCCQARNALRSELRRRRREQEAVSMADLNHPAPDCWNEMAPLLDEAMQQLDRNDQDAVIWRFFQGRSFRDIGLALAINEDTAQKRLSRALEKMRAYLVRRGVRLTAAGLAYGIAQHAVQAAPAGLAAQLTHASLAGAAASTSFASLLSTLKFQTALAGLLFFSGVMTPAVLTLAARVTSSRTSLPPVTDVRPLPPQPRQTNSEGSAALARLKDFLARTDSARPLQYDVNELSFLIWSLPASDYPLAWGLQKTLRWNSLQYEFPLNLFSYWAEIDPTAAMTAAQTLERCWDKNIGVASLALDVWAQHDAKAALAYARQLVPEPFRTAAMAWVIPRLAKSNLPAALASLDEIPPGMVYDRALSDVVDSIAAQDPQAAARYVEGLPGSKKRKRFFLIIAEKWAEKDANAAVQWVTTLHDAGVRADCGRGIIETVSVKHPAEAAAILDYMATNDPSGYGYIFAFRVVENWAKSDVPSALQWTLQLTNKVWRDNAIKHVLKEWSQQDPRAAAEFVANFPDGDEQQDWLGTALFDWSSQNPPAALDWINALPAGPLKDAGLKGAYDGFARSDPRQAASAVVKLPPGEFRSQAILAVVSSWRDSDFNAAANWVATFPEGKLRGDAAERIVGGWRTDADPARRWLSELKPGPSRDQAARAFVRNFAERAPYLAAPWVSAFTDKVEQNKQLERIAREWMKLDPDACGQWLKQTSLPEEAKQKLLAQ